MIYEVFSVHDSKAEAFLPPFILPMQAQAIRVFENCINSDDHQFGVNPHDYTLFRLGNFDDSSGQFLLARTIESLGNGVEFIRTDAQRDREVASNGQDTSLKQVTDGPSVLDGPTGEDSAS